MFYDPGKCTESIAMMIYYCQGTGWSLNSYCSLQGSSLSAQKSSTVLLCICLWEFEAEVLTYYGNHTVPHCHSTGIDPQY